MNDKIFASALACFFLLPGTFLFAQQAPDIFSGNPDVLYAMASRRFSPFAQFIFGGRKMTQEIDNLTLKKQLLNAWNDATEPWVTILNGATTPSKLRKTDPASLSAAALTGWSPGPCLAHSHRRIYSFLDE
jgi:hypothetical protein